MGNSMKTSLVAFIIMIVIIVFAGNLPGQSSAPEANLSSFGSNIVLAAPGYTPTPIQEQKISVEQKISQEQKITPEENITPEEIITPEEKISLSSLIELPLTSIFQVSPKKPNLVVYAPFVSSAELPTPTPTPEPTPTQAPPPPMPELDGEAEYISDTGKSWSDYPGSSIWPDFQVPPPVGILGHPVNQVNILLLGSDQRPNDSGFRTDTIQLLTINPSEGTVKLTAFPRDLYVYIPGYTMQRINTAFGWGGFEALADTMEYNFGVRPDYYVLIRFDAFQEGVDSLGGLTVSVGKDFCDHMDDFGNFCVSASDYWMNGRTALWYVRARYSTSDLDRGRRQQEVLEAAFRSVVSLNGLSRVPELYDIYKQNITTNVDLHLITYLLPVALRQANSPQIDNFSIGRGQVYDWINSYGSMVLVPIREPVLEVMREVISGQ
jgi:LCP family protein required for cell wall assembly